MGVAFPIEPMLAAPTTTLPHPRALPGGCWYEPKFDGYRAIVFVEDGRARVQSRRGADITEAFPDIAAAAASQLPSGTIVDGELVIWMEGRPDFPALQRRLAHRRKAVVLAADEPAHLLMFDQLAAPGLGLLRVPHRTRRAGVERLAAGLAPPLQLVPGTASHERAQEWLEDYGRVDVGIEGLVIKGSGTPYTPGRRGWLKYKIRDTAEAIVGAVIGTPESAERLVLGHYDMGGNLRIVGSTHSLRQPQRVELREHLFTAGDDHPWPHEIRPGGLGHWGGRELVQIHRVDPILVVEISADRAMGHGRWRHLTRYVRVRLDMDPSSITRR